MLCSGDSTFGCYNEETKFPDNKKRNLSYKVFFATLECFTLDEFHIYTSYSFSCIHHISNELYKDTSLIKLNFQLTVLSCGWELKLNECIYVHTIHG